MKKKKTKTSVSKTANKPQQRRCYGSDYEIEQGLRKMFNIPDNVSIKPDEDH